MNNLYLLQYQNYYNRMVDKPKPLSVYRGYMCQPREIDDVNPYQMDFVPNDGVYTEVVINWGGDNPDYVVITEGNTVISRWYVIESTRTRGGQYQLQLFRDLFADYYDQIMAAPAFIEKGYVSVNDSAIFNSENMTFNQIKSQEFLLKDTTNTGWVVGYCATPKEETTDKEITYGGIPVVDYYAPTLQDWDYYAYYNNPRIWMNSLTFNIRTVGTAVGQGQTTVYDYKFNADGLISNNSSVVTTDETYGYRTVYDGKDLITQNFLQAINNTPNLVQTAKNQFGLVENMGVYNALYSLDKKVLKVGDNTYYRIYTATDAQGIIQNNIRITASSNLGGQLKNIVSQINALSNDEVITGSPTDYTFTGSYTGNQIGVRLELITPTQGLEFTFPASRPSLEDAPYCMFCMPFGNFTYVAEDGTTVETDASNAITIASAIAEDLDAELYDIQLLPYVPIEYLRGLKGTLDLQTDVESKKNLTYIQIAQGKQILFFARQSQGNFRITFNQYIQNDPIRFKFLDQSRVFRLCSPNYASQFEFSAQKNGGVSYIEVNYTYKPYQPYIHLAPNFGRLYGKDFNDARGLICSGNFSLPITKNAFTEYELNNKNYELIFNRQIQNMEVNNNVQRQREEVQKWSGTLSGLTSGAMAGSFIGGGWGALAGGAIGGIVSLAAGEYDVKLNEMLRNEAIDYTMDQFGYQLGNIKALPNSLTRIGAFDINNKIFPFVEIYEATAEEERAFYNKIEYNGMTIMRIGTLGEFYAYKPTSITYGYFKGQLIRIEDINDDSHVANAIAKEFNKGWYII